LTLEHWAEITVRPATQPIRTLKCQRAPASSDELQRAPTNSSKLQRTPMSCTKLQRAAASGTKLQRAPASSNELQQAPMSFNEPNTTFAITEHHISTHRISHWGAHTEIWTLQWCSHAGCWMLKCGILLKSRSSELPRIAASSHELQ